MKKKPGRKGEPHVVTLTLAEAEWLVLYGFVWSVAHIRPRRGPRHHNLPKVKRFAGSRWIVT